jgi:hypothetical protein
MTIARNADGRLEQFAVNTNLPTSQSNVFHRWQTTPGGQWSSWQRMPGYLTAISASATADGRLELFGVNTRVPATENNNVFHRWQTTPGGSWTAWEHLGGYLTSLTAGTNADGRLEVFGINANLPTSQNNIFQRSQTPTGSWTGWQRVPGYLTQLVLTTTLDGRLELFGVNTRVPPSQNNNVFHRWQTTPGASWTAWERISGYLTSLTVSADTDGRLQLFGVNANLPVSQSNIFQRWQSQAGGGWTGWQRVPGYLTSVSLAANSDGRLELVGANTTVRTSLSNVLRRRQVTPGGNWTDWMRDAGEVVPLAVELQRRSRMIRRHPPWSV